MTHDVIVISGGESSEHDVSVASGADVAASLRDAGRFSVIAVHIDRDGGWRIGGPASPAVRFEDVVDELAPGTVVFPVLHGGWGEGGGLQRELEGRGIPYVGCDSASSARALSKSETLRACADRGVDVIPTRCVDRREYCADPDLVASALQKRLDGPVVVKPDAGGSSIGVHVVPHGRGLRPALDDVVARDGIALIQPLVQGHEVSVGVWMDREGAVHVTGASLLHLPTGADRDGFTYAHKYEGAGAVLEIPAPLPDDVTERLRDQALRCFTAVGCHGLARVDSFVEANGRIVLNEINTIPGLRRESHFPRLVAAAGTTYDRLIELLVEGATSRPASA